MQPHPYLVFEKFEYTCPLLLSNEHRLDPYLEIEFFFNGASLSHYRFELRSWFKIVLTAGLEIENHSNLLYFHNQLIQLIQAGYLIIENNIKYKSTNQYSDAGKSFKDWIGDMKKQKIDEGTGISGNYEVSLLSDAEIANPLFYLKQILTLRRIAEIRYGLQEWIYCAFNGRSSIATMDAQYVFDLFDDIGKVLEMLFILIAGDEALEGETT